MLKCQQSFSFCTFPPKGQEFASCPEQKQQPTPKISRDVVMVKTSTGTFTTLTKPIIYVPRQHVCDFAITSHTNEYFRYCKLYAFIHFSHKFGLTYLNTLASPLEFKIWLWSWGSIYKTQRSKHNQHFGPWPISTSLPLQENANLYGIHRGCTCVKISIYDVCVWLVLRSVSNMTERRSFSRCTLVCGKQSGCRHKYISPGERWYRSSHVHSRWISESTQNPNGHKTATHRNKSCKECGRATSWKKSSTRNKVLHFKSFAQNIIPTT